MAKPTAGPVKAPTHYQACSLRERVELAFIATLLEHGERLSVAISVHDLRNVQRVAVRQSEAIKRLKVDAHATRRPLSQAYFNALLTESVKVLPHAGELETERLEFYKNVLRRCFAWKKGRIPTEAYEKVMVYRPGLQLAFKLSEGQRQPKLL